MAALGKSMAAFALCAVVATSLAPQTQPVRRNVAGEQQVERNKALVLRWVDLLRGGNKNLAAAQALVTNDWVIHGSGVYPPGPEGLKQWQAQIDSMWLGRAPQTDDILAEGDKVVRRATVYRTLRSNGKESAMTVVFIYRIVGDKIAEVWRIADGLSSYQQVGAKVVMPAIHLDSTHGGVFSPAQSGRAAEEKERSRQQTAATTRILSAERSEKPGKASATSAERSKALVTRWAYAIWSRDVLTARSLVTDSCVIHAAGSTYERGPDGVSQWLAGLDSNWSYGGSTTDDIIAEGDKVVRRTTVFARYKPNDRGTVTPVVFIYRLVDTKIAEVWQVANYVSTYLQAGARFVIPGAPERSVKKSDAEQELLKTKQEFEDAALRNDADALARFYADDYAIIDHDGTLSDKATQLNRVSSGRLRYSALVPDDVVLRIYQDGAVVIERRKQTATFDGKPRPNKVRATEVWVKRQGDWRLVCTQITPIQEPLPTSGPFLSAPPGEQSAAKPKTATTALVTDTAGQIPKESSGAEREILKAMEEQDNGIRNNDADALARIWADDFLFVAWSGLLTNKEYQVEAQRTGFLRNISLTAKVQSVRIYRNLAVVIRHRSQVGSVGGITSSNPGSTRAGVWIERAGRWQLVSAQNTPIL